MCQTYTQAITYLSDECSGWSGSDRTTCENALMILQDSESDQNEKDTAMNDLNNLYWDCEQISDSSCFGQSIFSVSKTVDPNKPFPQIKV